MGLRSQLAKAVSDLTRGRAPADKVKLRGRAAITDSMPEPPVVARLVVEVRSDGSRTIARGALDVEGEAVALEARGTTPAQLAASLARSLLTAPALLRQLARASTRDDRGPLPAVQDEREDDDER
jgi:hypothetical protein